MNEQTKNDIITLIEGYKNVIKDVDNKDESLFNKLKKDFPCLISDDNREEVLKIINETI